MVKMAVMRANLRPSSISDHLLYLINSFVYNPAFQLVAGPLCQ